MGHGTRNDDERDYDQRQKGNQNEMAPADREYASAEPSVTLPRKGFTDVNGSGAGDSLRESDYAGPSR